MTIAHEVTGSGPDVLLLHSTICDRRMWAPQVPALTAAGFRVTTVDLRGFGESPLPGKPWNDADDVVALFGDEPVALVGSSGGGYVALEIAARFPERISGLVLLCGGFAGWPKSPQRLAYAEREDALIAAGDLEAAVELNIATWFGPDAGPEAEDAVRAMQRRVFELQPPEDPEPEQIEVDWDVAAITAPAVLVSGAHDLPDFRQIAEHLAGTLPRASHLPLDWAGHFPSLERPAVINSLLIETLRNL
ncbi:alpha/beta fold hydrolase [Actinoplanes sp. NPDC020271]|uniref:alpha/beta fold hydrolase n=1 Tax=Actinoplanes sp. NPDC020271 TaxID=3363896 RepID=UPI00378FD6C3